MTGGSEDGWRDLIVERIAFIHADVKDELRAMTENLQSLIKHTQEHDLRIREMEQTLKLFEKLSKVIGFVVAGLGLDKIIEFVRHSFK